MRLKGLDHTAIALVANLPSRARASRGFDEGRRHEDSRYRRLGGALDAREAQ